MPLNPYDIETDDGVSPTTILTLGLEILSSALREFGSSENTSSFAVELFGVGIAIVVFLFMALIAINLLMVLITAWISIFAAIIFLGFGGSQWTREYAINYFKNALTIGIKVMGTLLLVSLAEQLMNEFTEKIADFQLKDYATLLVAAFTLYKLIDVLPDQLANMVSGMGMGAGSMGSSGFSQMKRDVMAAATPFTMPFTARKSFKKAIQNHEYKKEQRQLKKEKKQKAKEKKESDAAKKFGGDSQGSASSDAPLPGNPHGGPPISPAEYAARKLGTASEATGKNGKKSIFGGRKKSSLSTDTKRNANTKKSGSNTSDNKKDSLNVDEQSTEDSKYDHSSKFGEQIYPDKIEKRSDQAEDVQAGETAQAEATDSNKTDPNHYMNSYEQRLSQSEQKNTQVEQEKTQAESERNAEKQKREIAEQGGLVQRPSSLDDKMSDLVNKFRNLHKKKNGPN